jgi:hypothetical protein
MCQRRKTLFGKPTPNSKGQKRMTMLPAVLPANLPSIAHAKLPAIYEAAKKSITECARIDECQDWANKAEALGSYAKQADDDTLHKMADRIQARAIRRCGELLRAITPAKNQHDSACTGTDTSRSQAAKDAGLSKRRKVTALRVANVPEDDFNQEVESDDPPTVTELAERGKRPAEYDHLKGRDPVDFKTATHLQGALRSLAKFLEDCDVAAGIRGSSDKELPLMVNNADFIIESVNKMLRLISKRRP